MSSLDVSHEAIASPQFVWVTMDLVLVEMTLIKVDFLVLLSLLTLGIIQRVRRSIDNGQLT